MVLLPAIAAALVLSPYAEGPRTESDPEGLSGISRAPNGTFWCADDRGGRVHAFAISTSPSNKNEVVSHFLKTQTLRGRKDLEGCAIDPLRPDVIWVSDESDTSIRAFRLADGFELNAISIPEVFRRHVRRNRSFEALTITPDGRSMWAANEDTLTCDGECAAKGKGGIVRLQEFTRTAADAPWQAARQLRYPTDPIRGEPDKGREISGVTAMTALPNGDLLVLEREFSRKNPVFPSFHARIYWIRPAQTGTTVAKTLVFDERTYFTNYEGMCLGPELPGGQRTLMLVSDAGGGSEAKFLILTWAFSAQ